MDIASFFDGVRPAFGGHLSEPQVSGIEAIIGEWALRGDGDPRKLAYLLATTKHETGGKMQPVPEAGNRRYFDKYEPETSIGKRLGNTKPNDGYLFRGRGFVQITGRANYRKFNIEDSPDKALQPDIAAGILVVGCMKGRFTGKKLADYINDDGCDFVNARRVVNGTDHAGLIATYAQAFLKALTEASAGATQLPQPSPAPTPPPVAPPAVGPRWVVLLRLVASIFSLIFKGRKHG